MPGKLSRGKVRRVYKFITDRSGEYDVKTLCRLLEVTRSGGLIANKHRPEKSRKVISTRCGKPAARQSEI